MKRRHAATIASQKQHEGAMSKEAAFHEVKHNPPAIVKSTAKKYGKEDARKQGIAIALSKAGLSKKGK